MQGLWELSEDYDKTLNRALQMPCTPAIRQGVEGLRESIKAFREGLGLANNGCAACHPGELEGVVESFPVVRSRLEALLTCMVVGTQAVRRATIEGEPIEVLLLRCHDSAQRDLERFGLVWL